jgi:hypothetical protein
LFLSDCSATVLILFVVFGLFWLGYPEHAHFAVGVGKFIDVLPKAPLQPKKLQQNQTTKQSYPPAYDCLTPAISLKNVIFYHISDAKNGHFSLFTGKR